MADPPKVPTLPGGPAPGSGNVNVGSGGTGGSGSSGSGGGGGGDPYLAAQRKAQAAAAQRYMDDAAALAGQIRSLRKGLNVTFLQGLEARMKNIKLEWKRSDADLLSGYRKRYGSFEGAAKDNEKAAAGQGYQNATNRGRERANALSEAMLQGAGESDVLRSQEMSLRNWDANQGEITRGFFDTLRSVNTGLTDLNVDTKTARLNAWSGMQDDREMTYNAYQAQRSEALTQLGNLLGQQGEYYGLANEQQGSKRARRLRKKAENQADKAFMQSANALGDAYEEPGTPKWLRKWDGKPQFGAGGMGDSTYREGLAQQAPTDLSRPEGATLRSW